MEEKWIRPSLIQFIRSKKLNPDTQPPGFRSLHGSVTGFSQTSSPQNRVKGGRLQVFYAVAVAMERFIRSFAGLFCLYNVCPSYTAFSRPVRRTEAREVVFKYLTSQLCLYKTLSARPPVLLSVQCQSVKYKGFRRPVLKKKPREVVFKYSIP